MSDADTVRGDDTAVALFPDDDNDRDSNDVVVSEEQSLSKSTENEKIARWSEKFSFQANLYP